MSLHGRSSTPKFDSHSLSQHRFCVQVLRVRVLRVRLFGEKMLCERGARNLKYEPAK